MTADPATPLEIAAQQAADREVPSAEPHVEALVDRAGDWQARYFDEEVGGHVFTPREIEAQQLLKDLMLCVSLADCRDLWLRAFRQGARWQQQQEVKATGSTASHDTAESPPRGNLLQHEQSLCRLIRPKQLRPCAEMTDDETVWCGACLLEKYAPARYAAARQGTVLAASSPEGDA